MQRELTPVKTSLTNALTIKLQNTTLTPYFFLPPTPDTSCLLINYQKKCLRTKKHAIWELNKTIFSFKLRGQVMS